MKKIFVFVFRELDALAEVGQAQEDSDAEGSEDGDDGAHSPVEVTVGQEVDGRVDVRQDVQRLKDDRPREEFGEKKEVTQFWVRYEGFEFLKACKNDED